MQVGLPVPGIARVEVAHGRALVDAGDLLRQEGGPAFLVVDPGEAQDHDRDRAVLGADQGLGLDLRFRVGPLRLDRPALVDPLARRAGRVHEQRAREHELADLVGLQLAQEPPRALDGHRPVLGVGLAREVVVGGEVDHRGDRRPVRALLGLGQRRPHALVRGQIDPDRGDARHGLLRLGDVEPDHLVAPRQPGRQGLAEEAAAAGDQDGIFLPCRHRSPRP
jgi:hypothetical protein